MQSLAELPPLPHYASLKPTPRSTPAIAALEATIGSLYRVTVAHTSRQFLGTFVCIDPQGNLVLDAALELELDSEGRVVSDPRGRDVGLVLIQRRWWTKVERLKSDEELRDELVRAQQAEAQGCAPS
ncbi:hypothetical protein JCM3775_000914 [Rhodotorula graminis]